MGASVAPLLVTSGAKSILYYIIFLRGSLCISDADYMFRKKGFGPYTCPAAVIL